MILRSPMRCGRSILRSHAASGLGATPFDLPAGDPPLSMPGVAAGVLLVFVLALGFYITPAMSAVRARSRCRC